MTGAPRRWAGPLLGLCATWALFAATAGATFTSWANHELMLLQTAVVGTAAIGATWIVLSGGIDLSVGANVALGTMAGAAVLRAGGPWPLAALATIATGGAVGFVLGALIVGKLARLLPAVAGAALAIAVAAAAALPPIAVVAVGTAAAATAWRCSRPLRWSLPLSPFVVTLGLWAALRGLAKGIGDNQPIYFPPTPALAACMQPGDAVLPYGVWILLALAALAAVALHRTVFGRHVQAIGSNREAARLAGIDVPRTEHAVYVLGGLCAGTAALLQLAYLSMGDPTTAQGLELRTIAAVVLGGASLAGGEGSIAGTLLGALVMTAIDNGCTKLGLDNWVQEVVTGAIIVAAVTLDRGRRPN